MKLFLAPHNDDEALFGAFTILREKPLVVVVTDGARHEKKGLVRMDVRRNESRQGCAVLGADVAFLGIPDDKLTFWEAEKAFRSMKVDPEVVYAPTWYGGGNPDHNVVGEAARAVWGDRVVGYSTYTAQCVKVEGMNEIIPTESELQKKRRALECYASQIKLNGQYFAAARMGSEYLD